MARLLCQVTVLSQYSYPLKKMRIYVQAPSSIEVHNPIPLTMQNYTRLALGHS